MWPSDILEEKILLFSSSLGCADVGDWKRSFPIDNHTQHIAYTNIICTTPSPSPRRLGKFKTPQKHHLLVYMVWCVMGRYIYIYRYIDMGYPMRVRISFDMFDGWFCIVIQSCVIFSSKANWILSFGSLTPRIWVYLHKVIWRFRYAVSRKCKLRWFGDYTI